MDEEREEREEKQQPAPNKQKKGLIYGAVILLQLIVAVVIVAFLILPKLSGQSSGEADAEPEEKPVEKKRKPIGQLYTISDLAINPKDSMGRRFGVFTVVIEVPDEETLELVSTYEPVIIDRFLNHFRTRTVEELALASAPEACRVALKGIVNEILVDKHIENIYFTRFVLE